MYISEKFVFVELHKTGGSHILKLLADATDGYVEGKHNRVPAAFHNRFIIGSVRNPWDWYVSLWAYGCSARGGIYHRLTNGLDFGYYHRQLCKEMGRDWLSPGILARQIYHDLLKPVPHWTALYADSDDIGAFQEWLHLVLSEERKFDIGEGYGFFPLSTGTGLMTYRYLKLFTSMGRALYNPDYLRGIETIEQCWEESGIVDFIVRNEKLEEDLIKALELAGAGLNEAAIENIRVSANNRSNTSRRMATEDYYDAGCRELVQQREAFIIKRHGYHFE